MLIILITLSGLLTIGLAVYGGYLTSSNPVHRKWFVGLGVIGALLAVLQGYYLHKDDSEKSSAFAALQTSVKNLQDQTVALGNALKLQATIDDFKHLETAISDGFSRIASNSVAKKPSPSVPPVSTQALGPAVVEHVRLVQRRAASSNPDAPFGLQAVLQTDVTIQPVAFKVNCDSEITDMNGARAFIVGEGAYGAYATAFSQDKKSFLFSFHTPAFTPNSSLVVSLQSKYDIHVVSVEKVEPLF